MTIDNNIHRLNPGSQTTAPGISVLQAAKKVESEVPEQQPLKSSQESSEKALTSAVNSQEKDAEDLQTAVRNINDYVQKIQRDLEFSIDDASGRQVVKVIDAENEEVIRQIPAEEMLDLARHLAEMNEDPALEEISIFSSIA